MNIAKIIATPFVALVLAVLARMPVRQMVTICSNGAILIQEALEERIRQRNIEEPHSI